MSFINEKLHRHTTPRLSFVVVRYKCLFVLHFRAVCRIFRWFFLCSQCRRNAVIFRIGDGRRSRMSFFLLSAAQPAPTDRPMSVAAMLCMLATSAAQIAHSEYPMAVAANKSFFMLPPAAAARPICTGEKRGANLLVFHSYGEGSHALSDALDNTACVGFMRDEQSQAQVDVLRAFFTSPFDTWAEATESAALKSNLTASKDAKYMRAVIETFKEEQVLNQCKCSTRGTLVRMDVLDGHPLKGSGRWTADDLHRAVSDLCPLFKPINGSSPVLPVVLVRMDALRWALSSYGRLADDVAGNPQFSTAPIEAVEYDLELLYQVVGKNVVTWRSKERSGTSAACVRPYTCTKPLTCARGCQRAWSTTCFRATMARPINCRSTTSKLCGTPTPMISPGSSPTQTRSSSCLRRAASRRWARCSQSKV